VRNRALAALLLAGLSLGAASQAPQEMPASIAEVMESVAFQGGFLQFQASQIRRIYGLMGGVVDCPVFPEPWDFVFPAPGPLEKGWTIALVRPGSEVPCAGFSVSPPSPERAGTFLRTKAAPTLDAEALTRLRMVRAARAEVDGALGPGRHLYVLVPSPSADRAQVCAWSELDGVASESTDPLRIGTAVVVAVAEGAEGPVARRVYALHEAPLAWDTRGAPLKIPLKLRSAQEFEETGFSPFDVLRALSNPHLCPRLLRTPSGALLIDADGSSRRVEGKELASCADLPGLLFPKALPPAPEFLRYKTQSKRLIRPGTEGISPADPAVPKPGEPQEPEAPILEWPLNRRT